MTNSKDRDGSTSRLMINLLLAAGILAVGGLTLFVFGQKPEIETKDDDSANQAALVRTTSISVFDEPFYLELDGEASSFRILTVSAEVSGQIEDKSENARNGHFVKKGELLFKIDDEIYQIELERKQAELDQIDEEIRSLNVDMDNQATLIALAEEDLGIRRRELSRIERLRGRDAATEGDLDGAKMTELASRNTVRRLQNELSSLRQRKLTKQANRKVVEAALKRAKYDLLQCRVVSPIAGHIIDEITEEGDHVMVGEELVHISDSNRAYVQCQLQLDELAWIWEQQIALRAKSPGKEQQPSLGDLIPIACEVVYEFAGVETIWDGVFSRFEGTGMNRETRTVPARIIVDEPKKMRVNQPSNGVAAITPPSLVSGMFVTVRIPIETTRQLLKVPVEAIRPGGKVWVNRDNKLEIINVTVGEVLSDYALVKQSGGGDLRPSDQVIVSPLASVQDGMAIRIQDLSEDESGQSEIEDQPEGEAAT